MNIQLDLDFAPKPQTPCTQAQQRRSTRSSWWFGQMRRATDSPPPAEATNPELIEAHPEITIAKAMARR